MIISTAQGSYRQGHKVVIETALELNIYYKLHHFQYPWHTSRENTIYIIYEVEDPEYDYIAWQHGESANDPNR